MISIHFNEGGPPRSEPYPEGSKVEQSGVGSGGWTREEHIEIIRKIKRLLMSGGMVGDMNFTDKEVKFLQQTVDNKPYELYRGIGIIDSRVTPEQFRQIKNLKVGDITPEFLQKQGNQFSSYTKSIGVAKYYSQGQISIVLKSNTSKNNILVDTTNLDKVLAKHGLRNEFDQNDYDYFRKDKEVIVIEPVISYVYSKK